MEPTIFTFIDKIPDDSDWRICEDEFEVDYGDILNLINLPQYTLDPNPPRKEA